MGDKSLALLIVFKVVLLTGCAGQYGAKRGKTASKTSAASEALKPSECLNSGSCADQVDYSVENSRYFAPYLRDSAQKYQGSYNRYENGFCGCHRDFVLTSRGGKDLGCLRKSEMPNGIPVANWAFEVGELGLSLRSVYEVDMAAEPQSSDYPCTRNVVLNCEPGQDQRDCGPKGACEPLDGRIGLCR